MPFAVAAAGISAAGSVVGGIMGASAADKAAGQAQAAQQQSLNFIKQVYGDTTNNVQPYIDTGQNALSSLAGLYGLPGGNPGGANAAFQAFTETPAYTFARDQGALTANRALAAQGLTGSGAQGKALTQYGQGYASTQFGSYIDQLAKLAGLGQNSSLGLGQIGTQTSGQVAGVNTNIGNAAAAGTIGANNSIAGGIQGALGALGNPNLLNSLMSGNSGNSASSTSYQNPINGG